MMNILKLKSKFVENGLSVSDVAQSLGISKSNLYQKLNSQGASLTVSEVVSIAKMLKLSKDEFNNIFFEDFVA